MTNCISSPLGIDLDDIEGASPSTLHLWDLFNDANGTLLTAHTPNVAPLGAAWAAVLDDHEIQSGRAQPPASVTAYLNVIDGGVSDGHMRYDYHKLPSDHSSNDGGFVFRAVDTVTGMWMLRFRGRTAEYGTGQLLLLKYPGPVVVDSVLFNIVAYRLYRPTIVLDGPSIQIYMDDQIVFDIEDSDHQTRQGVGIYSRDASGWNVERYDDLRVWTP